MFLLGTQNKKVLKLLEYIMILIGTSKCSEKIFDKQFTVEKEISFENRSFAFI